MDYTGDEEVRVEFHRPSNWDRLGKKYADEAKKYITSKLITSMKAMQQCILETPVYTGKTLINYHWSIGQAVEDVRKAVPNPRLPGKTSDLSIGREPRRLAQEVVLKYEFNNMLSEAKNNPYRNFILTNTAPNFLNIEYGTYRPGARTPPGGMTRRGESRITVILGAPSG